ncbi:citrate transporter [Lysinibacillus agricola]|uniref:Citrate transporter n=1 Tax=Lysinibacillus agricola TaxID=2590012 RepID=A0ABX7AQJ9_9BACI|nr:MULTISPECIES: citrate:proton symporter [Lysinibacillus]KOS63196.1 citrate transporter [Lysinibacillus sp. FJAT-14222]QQP12237.1 citrate transporter [Lysinibacillus agricola]
MSLSIIGFFTIIIIVALLISGRVSPLVAMVIPPIVAALIAGFNFDEVGEFFSSGLSSVMNVAVMFIFAIIFFGIMQDVGLFEPLINKMITLSKGNIIVVAVITVLIAVVAQLDGSGASTFLITIPALLPLYLRLRMNPYLLLLLIAGSAAVVNMVPWGGPLGRVASVLEVDVTELWYPLITIQIIGVVLMLALAVFLGFREKKRILKQYGTLDFTNDDHAITQGVVSSEVDTSLQRPKLLWINAIITVLVIGILVAGILPAGLAFLIGVAIALPINYRTPKDQMARVQAHAPNALTMASIIIAAGLFLGILNGTGMLTAIANNAVNILPSFLLSYLHIIIGVLGVPFDLLLSTDAYYFALFPVVEQIGLSFDIDSLSTGYAMIIGNIVGTFVSPLAPAVWLALGLSGLEMGKHLRYSFFWMWGLSITLLFIAVALGIIAI